MFKKAYSRRDLLQGKHLLRKNRPYVLSSVLRGWSYPWLREIETNRNLLELSTKIVIDIGTPEWMNEVILNDKKKKREKKHD